MSTVIIAVIVAAILGLAVRQMYKDKKAGKSPCGCKCSGCPNSSVCHSAGKEIPADRQ